MTTRTRFVLVLLAVALMHFVVFVCLVGATIALGDMPRPIPFWMNALGSMLGFPLFNLPEAWSLLLRPILGDDSVILFVMSGVNALLWGLALAATYAFVRSKRRNRST